MEKQLNLIEGIQMECNRVRELIPAYEEIGQAGFFGLSMLKAEILNAETAIASEDIVAMLRAFESLKGCE